MSRTPRFRLYWRKIGAHVHCRVFTNGLVGNLIFSEAEWPAVRRQLEKVMEVTPDVEPGSTAK